MSSSEDRAPEVGLSDEVRRDEQRRVRAIPGQRGYTVPTKDDARLTRIFKVRSGNQRVGLGCASVHWH